MFYQSTQEERKKLRFFRIIGLTIVLTPTLILAAAEDADAWWYIGNEPGDFRQGVIADPFDEETWLLPTNSVEIGHIQSESGDHPNTVVIECEGTDLFGYLGAPVKVSGRWHRSVSVAFNDMGEAFSEDCDIEVLGETHDSLNAGLEVQ